MELADGHRQLAEIVKNPLPKKSRLQKVCYTLAAVCFYTYFRGFIILKSFSSPNFNKCSLSQGARFIKMSELNFSFDDSSAILLNHCCIEIPSGATLL